MEWSLSSTVQAHANSHRPNSSHTATAHAKKTACKPEGPQQGSTPASRVQPEARKQRPGPPAGKGQACALKRCLKHRRTCPPRKHQKPSHNQPLLTEPRMHTAGPDAKPPEAKGNLQCSIPYPSPPTSTTRDSGQRRATGQKPGVHSRSTTGGGDGRRKPAVHTVALPQPHPPARLA